MKVTIITVGKLKEKYLKDGVDKYVKSLKNNCIVDLIEVQDEKTPDNASGKEEIKIKEKEGQAILKHVKEDMFVFALAIEGKMMSTEEFTRTFKGLKTREISNFTFVIGGSLGLSSEVLQRANYKLSFSRMTFPHQLMRVILLEQLSKVRLNLI